VTEEQRQTSFWLPEGLHRELRAAAAMADMPLSALIIEAIREKLGKATISGPPRVQKQAVEPEKQAPKAAEPVISSAGQLEFARERLKHTSHPLWTAYQLAVRAGTQPVGFLRYVEERKNGA
jgi:hypothetical protein